MNAMGHDIRRGLIWALASSLAFAWSGTFARPLLDAGWSVGLVITGRVLSASVFLAVPALLALRGRWSLVRAEAGAIVMYGAVVVAMTQTAYYQAVARMDVGVALLIEYAAPVAVLLWLWGRHGQRPSRLTLLGALVAVAGLMLVIDLFSGADLDLVGLAWALASMVGCAVYFVLSARSSLLPPVALTALGMFFGAIVLLVGAALGVVTMAAGAQQVAFRSVEVPWFVPLLGIGLVSTAMAYALGMVGGRMLGARLMSFVSLVEVVGAVVAAWLLLGQQPSVVQLAGGLGILLGVVLVKLGEPAADESAGPAAAGDVGRAGVAELPGSVDNPPFVPLAQYPVPATGSLLGD